MKNKAFYPFENKIMDKRVNIIETDLRNKNRRCINEVNRLPVKYSVGNDYLYTYRIFDIKKKYINREITKEQYEMLMRIVRDKMNIDRNRIKQCLSDLHDSEPMKNKRFKR